MTRISAMMLFCAGATGCVTPHDHAKLADHPPKREPGWEQREADYYWGTGTYLCNNYAPTGTPDSWCQIANDKSRTRERRCVAAALVFGGFVKPGFDSKRMRAAIPDSRWLDDSPVEQVDIVGGRWPYTIKGFHFYITLFPKPEAHPYWRIDFTLTAANESHVVSLEDARRFLRGTLPDKAVRIQEFIMMFPLPNTKFAFVEELHNPRGVGIKVVPEGWYEF